MASDVVLYPLDAAAVFIVAKSHIELWGAYLVDSLQNTSPSFHALPVSYSRPFTLFIPNVLISDWACGLQPIWAYIASFSKA